MQRREPRTNRRVNVLEKRAEFFDNTINMRSDEQNAVQRGGGQRSDALLEGRCNCNSVAVNRETNSIELAKRHQLFNVEDESRSDILGDAEGIVPVGASPSSCRMTSKKWCGEAPGGWTEKPDSSIEITVGPARNNGSISYFCH